MGTPLSQQADAYQGFEEPETRGAGLNAIAFVFDQMLSRVWTMIPVKVVSINVAGTLSGPGKVDVHPLVSQVDGGGQAVPHGTVYGLPVWRLQSGASGVVMDPTAGDIGIALFAQRDISAVVADPGPNVPGSRRSFDPADGVYLGGILNGAVSRYVQFDPAAGIKITDPLAVTVTAPTVTVNAATKATINSPVVLLGGSSGGKKVVLDGDPVVAGVVVASSTATRAV